MQSEIHPAILYKYNNKTKYSLKRFTLFFHFGSLIIYYDAQLPTFFQIMNFEMLENSLDCL